MKSTLETLFVDDRSGFEHGQPFRIGAVGGDAVARRLLEPFLRNHFGAQESSHVGGRRRGGSLVGIYCIQARMLKLFIT